MRSTFNCHKLSLLGLALLAVNSVTYAGSMPDVHAYSLVQIAESCPTGYVVVNKNTRYHLQMLKGVLKPQQTVGLANGYVMTGGATYGFDIKPGSASMVACYGQDFKVPSPQPQLPEPEIPSVSLVRFSRTDVAVCPAGYSPIGEERAKEKTQAILNTVLTGLWDWANVSSTHIMGGPGYGGQIKASIPTSTMICERNNTGLTKRLQVEAVEMLPDLSNGVIPIIFANGLMQYPIDVKVKLSIDGKPVNLSDHNTALNYDGSPINLVRLYLGPDYNEARSVEIPVDGEQVGAVDGDWTASRFENKYEKAMPNFAVHEAPTLSNKEQETGWAVYRYWISSKAATPHGRPVEICAVIGNRENQVNSCDDQESVSLYAQQPARYNNNDFSIKVTTPHNNASDDSRIDVISVQPRGFVLKDVSFSYLPARLGPDGMKLVGTYAEYEKSLIGQYFHWNSQLYLLDRYNDLISSPAIPGFNYWTKKESTLAHPYMEANTSGLTFVNTRSFVYKIILGTNTGWNLDPNRYFPGPYAVYVDKNPVPLTITQVEGRDQYGNRVRFAIGFNSQRDTMKYSVSVN